MSNWINVIDQLPPDGELVVAAFFDQENARKYGTLAVFMRRSPSVEPMGDEWQDFVEYDNELGVYSVPEGWYIRHESWWGGLTITAHDYVVSHWLALPEAP